MTRDEALENAIAACGQVMIVAREYFDMKTAEVAMEAQRALVRRRSEAQIAKMEQASGLQECDPLR